jgi:hypothetical protein
MKRVACLLTLLAVTSSAHAAAQDDWEVGLRVGGMITDNALRLDGSAEFLTITRRLDDKRAVELEFGADQLDFSMDYGLRHRTVSVNYVEVNREPLWDPYVLIGVGVSEFDAPTGITEGRDAMMQVATGGSWELSDNGKLLLRGDLRFRYDLNDTGQPGQDGWGDAIFTVGLSYRF